MPLQIIKVRWTLDSEFKYILDRAKAKKNLVSIWVSCLVLLLLTNWLLYYKGNYFEADIMLISMISSIQMIGEWWWGLPETELRLFHYEVMYVFLLMTIHCTQWSDGTVAEARKPSIPGALPPAWWGGPLPPSGGEHRGHCGHHSVTGGLGP